MRRAFYLLFLLLFACAPDSGDDTPSAAKLQILSITSPRPMVAGTRIYIEPQALFGTPTLELHTDDLHFDLPLVERDGTQLVFALERSHVEALGLGEHTLEVILRNETDESIPWNWPIELVDAFPSSAPELSRASVDWHQAIDVRGTGFIFPAEGFQAIVFDGTYFTDAGERMDVAAFLPLTPSTALNRTRGTFTLDPTEFGTSEPGQFAGEAYIYTEVNGGTSYESARGGVEINIRPAAILSIEPPVVRVGEYLTFNTFGLGTTPAQVTNVSFEGRFNDGDSFHDVSFSALAESNQDDQVVIGVPSEFLRGETVASWFARSSGGFSGEFTILVSGGSLPQVLSGPFEGQVVLAKPMQYVWLQIGDSFDAGLRLFGLGAARDPIIEGVQTQLRALFRGVRLEVVMTEPTNALPEVVTTLEIDGLDPFGIGLAGHDATPHRDDRNSVMSDAIGGSASLVQPSGINGYGGVFLENYLDYSEATRGELAPGTDPLFDTVFGPTMNVAATSDEVDGIGDAERIEAIDAAVDALIKIIAEQAAHQLGHALGLPSPGTTHNTNDAPGCLMDAHDARPFGERAGLSGFGATTLCAASAGMLTTVLGD